VAGVPLRPLSPLIPFMEAMGERARKALWKWWQRNNPTVRRLNSQEAVAARVKSRCPDRAIRPCRRPVGAPIVSLIGFGGPSDG